ncbi:hypothetical protein U3516DRAFT_787696 [Neocallimastix sp. 'constans']
MEERSQKDFNPLNQHKINILDFELSTFDVLLCLGDYDYEYSKFMWPNNYERDYYTGKYQEYNDNINESFYDYCKKHNVIIFSVYDYVYARSHYSATFKDFNNVDGWEISVEQCEQKDNKVTKIKIQKDLVDYFVFDTLFICSNIQCIFNIKLNELPIFLTIFPTNVYNNCIFELITSLDTSTTIIKYYNLT